ncbi:MAG: serine/threonine protein kinase [Phycisphaerae bacterium]|nr:serine/threonine protein kinase [Phycisphaerae bacterium]
MCADASGDQPGDAVELEAARAVAAFLEARGAQPGLSPERFAPHDPQAAAMFQEAVDALGHLPAAMPSGSQSAGRGSAGQAFVDRHQADFSKTVFLAPGSGPCGRESPSKPTALPTTDSIEGYRLLSEIHRGGQGIVYKAIQKATKRTVALKVLREGPFAGPRERLRFEREIALVASLEHPNIVTIYDSGVATGQHFFVMEYIHGKLLDRYVFDKQLGLRETLQLFEKVCAAVAYAHQHGVIHRDLKPGNILVDARGEPHIIDFGLAKIAGPGWAAGGVAVTVTSEFLGTLAYASPEQTLGDPALVDIRTDVYSLGVILYELVTGNFPYPVVGNMKDILKAISETPPEPPSSWHRRSRRESASRKAIPHRINDELDTIILKALAKAKERRYSSAEELRRDLAHYLQGESIEAKRDSAWYVLRKLARRNIYATATVISLLVILCSSTYISFDFYRQTREALDQRETSYKELAKNNKDLSRIINGTHSMVRYRALSGFLSAWRADSLGRAQKSLERVTGPLTPEKAVILFLLDEQYTLEQLIADLPEGDIALAYFAAGERHCKAGRASEAIRAFKTAINSKGDRWTKSVCQARLLELRRRADNQRAIEDKNHELDKATISTPD